MVLYARSSCDDKSSELACSDKGAPVSETIGPIAVKVGVPVFLYLDQDTSAVRKIIFSPDLAPLDTGKPGPKKGLP